MATEQQGGGSVTATSTVNNGGTAVNVGTSTILDNQALGSPDVGVFASTPIDNDSADKALSGGTFAFDNQTGLIMRVTNTLAGGVSNTFLQFAADDVANGQSIHQVSGIYITDETSAIRAGAWNAYSGEFSPAVTGELSNFGIDEAANPSRTTPGELAYMDGSPNPVTDEYSKKNT